MESALLGLVLDSSVLIAAERKKLTTSEAIKKIREAAGTPERSRMRRQFLDELKAHVPVHPVTESTAEIIARVGAEQAASSAPFSSRLLSKGRCREHSSYEGQGFCSTTCRRTFR